MKNTELWSRNTDRKILTGLCAGLSLQWRVLSELSFLCPQRMPGIWGLSLLNEVQSLG